MRFMHIRVIIYIYLHVYIINIAYILKSSLSHDKMEVAYYIVLSSSFTEEVSTYET